MLDSKPCQNNARLIAGFFMPIRKLPYPQWLIALLSPLNNRYLWRTRLRILESMTPSWARINQEISPMGKQTKKPAPPSGKGKGKGRGC